MYAKILPRRKADGFRIVDGGCSPIFDAQGFQSNECVEVYFGDYGMLDMVEPDVIIRMKPKEAFLFAEQLRLAALAVKGYCEVRDKESGG